MFKKVKENKKGFTLAELLIVVAIIAVLVAISIPIFTTQLEKARQSTDAANLRAAYAEAAVKALESEADATVVSEKMTQTNGSFDKMADVEIGGVKLSTITVTKGKTVSVKVTAADGTVTFTPES